MSKICPSISSTCLANLVETLKARLDVVPSLLVKPFEELGQTSIQLATYVAGIKPEDVLSTPEILELAASWREIEEGKSRTFTDMEEFLRELKT